jgi:hypothetical protein
MTDGVPGDDVGFPTPVPVEIKVKTDIDPDKICLNCGEMRPNASCIICSHCGASMCE